MLHDKLLPNPVIITFISLLTDCGCDKAVLGSIGIY